MDTSLLQSNTTLKVPTGVADFNNLTSTPKLQGELQPALPPVPSAVDVSSYADLYNQERVAAQQAVQPQENAHTSIIDQYKQARAGLEGKNQFTQDVTQTQDVMGKEKNVADIINQIRSQNALTDANKISYGANVGGITSRDYQLFGREADRQNAVQQLSLGAKLAAAKDDLAMAEKFVERAVNAKYADQEIKVNNLKEYLTLNKDELERVDAKAYKEQIARTAAREKDLAVQKKNESDLQGMLVAASSQGAPADLIARAEKATNPTQRAMILGQYAGDFYKTELLKAQIATEKAQRGNYLANTNKTNKEVSLLGQQPTTIDGQIATLPKATQERYYKLQGDFDAATKNYRGAIDATNNIKALSKDSTAQDQTAIVFSYMKALDPASTVREGEFALVGATAGLGDRAINALKKLDSGKKLSEEQIKEITGAADKLANTARTNLEGTSKEFDRRAVKFGLPTGLFYEAQPVVKEEVVVGDILKTLNNVSGQVNGQMSTQALIESLYPKKP